MTFLELCQKVAAESGTIQGTKPTAVTGQTGRLKDIVRWTGDAWRSIQNAHARWRWMEGEFTGSLSSGTQRYDGTDFDDVATSASITRFAEWLYADEYENRFSLYKTATGVSDEGPIRFLFWEEFYVTQLRGTQTADRPRFFSVSPANQIVFSPSPDATYTVRGPFRKSTQELSADGDIPEMPVRFHDVIVSAALELLGDYDESVTQIPLWRLRKMRGFSELERDQLPRIRMAGALA